MEWGGHLCRVLTGSEQGDRSPSICSCLLLCQVVARRGLHSEEQPWRRLQTCPHQSRVVVTGGPVTQHQSQAQYVQASPACQPVQSTRRSPSSSPVTSEVRHSNNQSHLPHTTAILTHSTEQSLHAPLIDHSTFLFLNTKC